MNVIPVNAPDTLPIIFERGTHASTLKDWKLIEDACNKHSRDGDGILGCLSKTSHAPQRITLAKPGRVVGLLSPYENGNLIKQAYDPRTLVKNAKNRSARMKSETLVRLEFT